MGMIKVKIAVKVVLKNKKYKKFFIYILLFLNVKSLFFFFWINIFVIFLILRRCLFINNIFLQIVIDDFV